VLFGQYAFLFSGFDTNGAVSVAGSINVDASGNVTGEEDFKDPSNLATAQSISGFCRNYPVAMTGFCSLTVLINNTSTTYQYDFALRSDGLVAHFFENSAMDGQNTTGSGVLITQDAGASGELTTANGYNGYFNFSFVGTDAAGRRVGVEGNIFTDQTATITPPPSPAVFPSQADVNDFTNLIQPIDSVTPNVVGSMTGPVDANGRATATITIGGTQTLTLAVYIVAPEDSSTNHNAGRALAIDITPVDTNAQVLGGQFFAINTVQFPAPPPPFDNTMISGVNVFALSGVVPGTPKPARLPSSNTVIGTLTAQTAGSSVVLLDENNGGSVSNAVPGTYTLGNVASNGRVMLTANVNSKNFTYVLYLDAPNDGTILETAGDNTVSFGIFTGQATGGFSNSNITGPYIIGTAMPVLASVPNGAAPLTLTPSTTVADSGTFSVAAGAVTGNYSFDPTTGRGTATANSGGTIFQNGGAVFYIISPKIMVLMGADPVPNDAIAFMQF
jgi:hypothetical protein